MAKEYITKPGDFWDTIAKDCYNNELLADVIMQANIEHIGTFRFSAGTILVIPDMPEDAEDGLPPWRD